EGARQRQEQKLLDLHGGQCSPRSRPAASVAHDRADGPSYPGYNPVFGAKLMRLLGKALTFDDVLLVPAYSQVLPKDTSLATRFSRNIPRNLPLVSAAMDTVTEARLAI